MFSSLGKGRTFKGIPHPIALGAIPKQLRTSPYSYIPNTPPYRQGKSANSNSCERTEDFLPSWRAYWTMEVSLYCYGCFYRANSIGIRKAQRLHGLNIRCRLGYETRPTRTARTARTVSILFKGFWGKYEKKYRSVRVVRDTKTVLPQGHLAAEAGFLRIRIFRPRVLKLISIRVSCLFQAERWPRSLFSSLSRASSP